MHNFRYKRNRLYCENIPITKIAQHAGTPVFIYSKKTLLSNYYNLDKAFSKVSHLICYSVKANSNISICRALIKTGAGMDIVSGGELYRALKAGANNRKIVFAGVGKTKEEIEEALKRKILFFTVESIQELELINQIAKNRNTKAPAVLRINPEINIPSHRYTATGKKGTKFGLSIPAARQLYRQRKNFPYINFTGIQMHIGSQITKPSVYTKALKKILPLTNEIKKYIPSIRFLDIGGGFGINYTGGKAVEAKKFGRAVLPIIKNLGLTVVLEPGRFIAGNAGILVAKVLYTKQDKERNIIITDSGMNDFIRPSLYHAYHRVLPVIKNSAKKITADIVGPVCETGDFFALARKTQKPRQGDILAIMDAGAYGFSMASNYNSRPRPAEVMVAENRFRLIRKREDYKTLIQGEK